MSASSSPMTGILKFIGAVIVSIVTLSLAMFIAGTLSPGADTLGSQRWMTGMILTILGMVIGIAATYAPNPLDDPNNASSMFTNMFEWVGMMTFFGGLALFVSAQASQFKF